MITKRNLLCVKRKEKLDLGLMLLYEPYKNILVNFKELCIDINVKDFDPVAKVYDGLLSVPSEIKEYYESLLGVTSYYQHSQGGKGRYIEKKIASVFDSCSLDIVLSELPFWLEHPILHKKKGIFTLRGLSLEEKRLIRTTRWNWIGDRDESTDVGNILKDENTMVLIEIKNRVDSGGVAARREIWTSQKFGIIIDYLLTNEMLYLKDSKKFSLSDLLDSYGIKTLELYIGILFDKKDSPATLESDRRNGFYSSSKEGFTFLKDKIKSSKQVRVENEDFENLQMELLLVNSNLRLKIGALYGNDVSLKLFRQEFPVSDLLLLRYDDMWLSQLTTIDERMFLIKYGKNSMTIFISLLKRDENLRIKYNSLIESECEDNELQELVIYLLKHYSNLFDDKITPAEKDKEEYLADVIQVLCACEA